MNLKLKLNVENKCDDTILITGSARSGTTILGQVIHSMTNVEYVFEPPTLVSLFSLINKIEEKDWKLLFQTYLYEDFFMNALAGRNLNFNKNDDSCIYNTKPKEEVNKRFNNSLRKTKIEEGAEAGIIAYKIPDIVPFLDRYLEYFPKSRIVFMKRNPVDTLNSLMSKGWFSNESLNNENRIWPFIKYKENAIPYWVSNDEFDYWLSLSELDRCAYYFLKTNTAPKKENVHIIDYDQMLKKPDSVISNLAFHLGLEYGKLTKQIIDSIKYTIKERDSHILDKLDKSIAAFF